MTISRVGRRDFKILEAWLPRARMHAAQGHVFYGSADARLRDMAKTIIEHE